MRFVGDARERIREDVLRLLRFVRFHAYYGTPPPDPEALRACAEMAPLLVSLSAERVRAELVRIMLAVDPASVLSLMAENGVLAHILPEARQFDRLRDLVGLEAAQSIAPDAIRRLAAVLVVDAAGAEAVAIRLRFSKAERAQLVGLAAMPEDLAFGDDDPAQRQALYRLGAARYRDLLLLATVDNGDDDLLGRCLAAARDWHPRSLPVAGADLLKLGMAPGPEVGGVLGTIEDWWVAGDFRADRDACQVKLKELMNDVD